MEILSYEFSQMRIRAIYARTNGPAQKGSWNLIDGEEKKTKGRTWDGVTQATSHYEERDEKNTTLSSGYERLSKTLCVSFFRRRTLETEKGRERERERARTYVRT